MTIVAIFKNNVSVFMHQLAKFPQDSNRKINEQMPMTLTNCEFYNDSTNDGSPRPLKNTITRAGFLKISGHQRIVNTFKIMLKKNGNGKTVFAEHLDNADNQLSFSDSLAPVSISTTATLYEFDLTQNGTPEPFRQGQRIVIKSGVGTDTDNIQVHYNNSSNVELAKSYGNTDNPITWVDDLTESPAAIVSSSGGACP